jgi:hypothetical protein
VYQPVFIAYTSDNRRPVGIFHNCGFNLVLDWNF